MACTAKLVTITWEALYLQLRYLQHGSTVLNCNLYPINVYSILTAHMLLTWKQDSRPRGDKIEVAH